MLGNTDQVAVRMQQRDLWLARAEALRPELIQEVHHPLCQSRLVADSQAFQDWRCVPADGPIGELKLFAGMEVILDWGTHYVGFLRARLRGRAVVELQVAEIPSELGDSVVDYPACFPIGWQPGTVVWDQDYWHGQRQSLRWLRIHVREADPGTVLEELIFISQSAVGSAPCPPRVLSPREAAIDQVCCRTLRNCLHDVFEDGPKRDRRLWLGDLRLQARLAYQLWDVSDLVERCLLLHAACRRSDGMVPACVFLKPEPHHATEFIPDYALLFGDTVLDWLQAGGNEATAKELLPVAMDQLELIAAWTNGHGVLELPQGPWFFVDWCDALDRQGPLQGIAVFAARRCEILATRLGDAELAARARAHAQRWTEGAHELFDAEIGVFRSGSSGQISWATQAWMVLAGVKTGIDAQQVLRKVGSDPESIYPVSPYLMHHVLEAHLQVDLFPQAWQLCEGMWGAMVDLGADTFWEVFDAKDHWRSPYKSHLFNSACHAWSCTPSIFIRNGVLREC